MGTKLVVIMQGLPGSGKSFVAEALRAKMNMDIFGVSKDYLPEPKCVICRTEDSLVEDDCYMRFKRALRSGKCAILDSTNLKRSDVRRYVELARDLGYVIEIINVSVDLLEGVRRSKHGTRDLASMRNGMQDLRSLLR